MKLILSSIFVAFCLLPVHAQLLGTTPQSLNFSFSYAGGSGSVTFTPFDTTLGTLVSETLSLSVTSSANQTIGSAAAYSETISAPFRLSITGVPNSQIDSETITLNPSGTAPYASYVINPSSTFNATYTLGSTLADAFTYLNTSTTFSNHDTGNRITNSTYATAGTLTLTYNYNAAPEPSTWALLLGGISALVFIYRRRRNAQATLAD